MVKYNARLRGNISPGGRLISDGGFGKKVDPSDYSVQYFNNIAEGKATICVTASGSGLTGCTVINFKIK